jgi:hypothetical protein
MIERAPGGRMSRLVAAREVPGTCQDGRVSAMEVQRGDVIGAQVRRVIVGSVSVGVVFTLWVVLSKVSRAVEGHLPWQDDPFDILTSFDFILPPVLVAAIA